MRRTMCIALLSFLIGIIQASAQVTTVRGTVVSQEDGQPVVGASVLIKGGVTEVL